MLQRVSFLLVVLIHSASAGKKWQKHHSGCGMAVSEGPAGAGVEIRLGDLPASTSERSLYLSWWAARKSATAYNPFVDPDRAEVHECPRKSYAAAGDEDFNGGKVRITEAGEATLRVHAPSTYRGHRHHQGNRMPHVHFAICGERGHPKKVLFTFDGVQIKGGCKKRGRSNAVSYRVISAREIDSNMSAIVLSDNGHDSSTSDRTDRPDGKDWDALEFSDVYECLDDTKVYDQFSSGCATHCPATADIAHGQCVRKEDASQKAIVLQAGWRLRLDCNHKCWKDTTPVSRHSLRLALADHLDITFQEAHKVRLHKDGGSPTTHAHVTIVVKTRRLNSDIGSSLLKSFLANSSVASDVLGLLVHEVEQVSLEPGLGEASSEEDSDEYAPYYRPLEKAAEEKARSERQGAANSIAGVPLPDGVPVVAIVGAAAGVVLVLSGLLVFLCCRRRRQLAAAQATGEAKNVEGTVVESNVKDAV